MSIVGDAIGGLFGGGSTPQAVQTVQNTSTPWSGQQSFLTDIYNRSKTLSNTPKTYFPGQTITPFSADTTSGMDSSRAMASAPNQLAGTSSDQLLSMLQRGGYGINFDANSAPLRGIMSGANGIDASRFENIANGSMLGGNPYIDQVIGQITDDASSAVNRNAFLKGREGSNWHAGSVADQIAKTTAPIRLQDYASERGYMDSAMSSLANIQGSNIANQAQASGSLLNADNTAMSNLGAAFSAAPGVDSFQYANADRLMSLGGLQEQKQAEGIQDAIARHDFAQNEPTDRLNRYAATVFGSPSFSNSTTTTSAPPPQTSLGQVAGGILGGLGSAVTAGFNPWLGAGLGLLGGLG